MARTRSKSRPAAEPEKYYFDGTKIPMAVIRRYARQIAERFKPDKIVLFGSHAYGRPHKDSDVDLLVIMPARNQHDQAFRIRWQLPAPFPMDLLVRTPKTLKWLLDDEEAFHKTIMTTGKVLYEVKNASVGSQRRKRLPTGGSNIDRS